jgi:ubiquinone/menaquinone biosynthesis C-methylase UbiE
MNAFEKQTRAVFDAHHREQDKDEAIFQRLVSLVSEEYFGFPRGAFAGMKILDAGCGSNANASFAALALGAGHVTSLDMGEGWQPVARRRLQRWSDRSTLVAGSVLELPFKDGQFDFVHCAGVLHHSADAARGFAELARVTRPGGHCFVSIMCNGDGALYRCFNALREVYARDPEFRKTVQELSQEKLDSGLDWLLSEKDNHEAERIPGENAFFRSLFDRDLLLTIKDRIEAPTYYEFAISEAMMRNWYERAGFTEVRRVTRYTKHFQNLRRFLAPMYLHYDHPISRFWFGEGYVQVVGRKA